MRIVNTLFIGLFSVILFAFLVITPASAAGTVNSSPLREAVTLDAVRDHQAAFQAIADANGGVRTSGTLGFDDSAAYVATQLEAAGYNVSLQTFNYPFFMELSAPEFEQLAPTPTVYPSDDFATMTYSGSGDVTAMIEGVDITIPFGSTANTSTSGCEPSDFAAFTPGRVALLQRGSCFFQTKALNAQAAGAVAVIIFNEGQLGRTDAFFGTLGLPVVTVPVIATSYAIGNSLYMGTDVTVRIDVDAISDYRDTFNVIADLPGHKDRVVMAGAHLDSVPAGPGINDNGSGSAALLEIALQMADLNITPRNTVRFAWWGAEEAGLVGSSYYVNNLSVDEIKDIGAYLEFEMLGSPNFVRFVFDGDGSDFPSPAPEGSANIEQVINDYFADQGLAVESTPFNLRHSYRAFSLVGIPAGGLFGGAEGIKTDAQVITFGGTAGIQYDPCYHLACDTFANVNLTALDEMSDAAAHVILTLGMTTNTVPKTQNRPPNCEDLGYDFGLKVEPEYCEKSSGFWTNHPEAWPVSSIDIGGVTYSKDEAIAVMSAKAKGDKTYSLFTETVAAKLNALVCGPVSNETSAAIAAADGWLALHPPGSGVKSKDAEWDEGSVYFSALSAFNNGAFWSDIFPIDGLGFVEVETEDGIYLDWTSTRSADAVIVKGGRGANLYEYDPESFGDIDLHAPVNPKNDKSYALSYIEFCFDYDIEISVRKFHDVNNNGLWDPGEPEIGVEVFIHPDGTLGGTTGWPYLFTYPTDVGFDTDLFWTPETHERSFAGVYTVEEFVFPIWEQTALMLDGVAQPLSPQLNIPYAGDADESYEVIFGNIGYAEIRGMKFEDLNGNSVREAAEPGLPGVEITLDGTDVLGNAVLLTTVTGAGGEFSFTELIPGDYTVTETAWPVGGWQPSTSVSSGPHTVHTGDVLDLDWIFGNYLPGSIHGYKFNDINGNGLDDDDPRLPGVTITLTGDVDGDGDIDQVSTLTSDPNGEYWFTGLYPGDYTVAETPPVGWVATTPASVDVTVTSGVELVALDGQAMLSDEQIAAGYVEVLDQRLTFGNSELGSIHGYKFNDLNGNGVDDGEPRLPSWTIELSLDDGTLVATATTDENGEYWFTDLNLGTYQVREQNQAGWVQTTPNPPPLTIESGQEYVAVDGQAMLGPESTKVEVLEPLLAFGNFESPGYIQICKDTATTSDANPVFTVNLMGSDSDLPASTGLQHAECDFGLGDPGQVDLTAGAGYSVSEDAVTGWDSTVECVGSGGAEDPDNIDVSPNEEVVCTFTNTEHGMIEVEKQTLPDGSGQTFEFNGNLAGIIGDGGVLSSTVSAGQYSTTEIVPAGDRHHL